MKLLLFLLLIIIFVLLVLYAIMAEKKAFNNCKCPKCGKKLRLFDCDSQGGRGWCCDECTYHTWVSYKIVDNKYIKEEK